MNKLYIKALAAERLPPDVLREEVDYFTGANVQHLQRLHKDKCSLEALRRRLQMAQGTYKEPGKLG